MEREPKAVDIAAVVVRRPVMNGEPEISSDELSQAILSVLYDPRRRGPGQSPVYGQSLPSRTEALLQRRMGSLGGQPVKSNPPMLVRYRMTSKSWEYLQAGILCGVGALLAFLVARQF